MSGAYYNDHEKYVCDWTRNLIGAGLIAPGVVDDRSIKSVVAEDVRGAAQAHFFSGYGTWSYALRLAGVPDDLECWTGSCPCTPFSQAGLGRGFDDERHLWPDFFRLIQECRPPVVFGENVASPAGLEWFSVVRADLEREGYAVGAADLPAASVGAPHIRQRLFFVADSTDGRWSERARQASEACDGRASESGGPCASGRLAHHHHHRLEILRSAGLSEDSDAPFGHDADGCSEALGLGDSSSRSGRHAGAVSGAQAQGGGEWVDSGRIADEPFAAGPVGELGHHHHQGLEGWGQRRHSTDERSLGPSGVVGGFWSDAEWIYCRDEKWRPAKPGAFPLAYGTSGRLALVRTREQAEPETRWYNRAGALKAIGNGIVAPVAATFIRAFIESTQHLCERAEQ